MKQAGNIHGIPAGTESGYRHGVTGMALSPLASHSQPTNQPMGNVDWQRVFTVTANLLGITALVYIAYRYSVYFRVFGAGALAMSGQFIIGLFFMACIFNATENGQVMLAAFGLYLLVNVF